MVLVALFILIVAFKLYDNCKVRCKCCYPDFVREETKITATTQTAGDRHNRAHA